MLELKKYGFDLFRLLSLLRWLSSIQSSTLLLVAVGALVSGDFVGQRRLIPYDGCTRTPLASASILHDTTANT